MEYKLSEKSYIKYKLSELFYREEGSRELLTLGASQSKLSSQKTLPNRTDALLLKISSKRVLLEKITSHSSIEKSSLGGLFYQIKISDSTSVA